MAELVDALASGAMTSMVSTGHHQTCSLALTNLDFRHHSASEKWAIPTLRHTLKIFNRLEFYIFTKLGNLPLNKIDAVETIEVITPVAVRGKLKTVKKLCRWINEIILYAINTGLIHANPLSNIGKAFGKCETFNCSGSISIIFMGRLTCRRDSGTVLRDDLNPRGEAS